MGIFLLHFGLEGFKIHKIKRKISLPISSKFAIQNNPLMQLRNFSQSVNKNKLKLWKFQSKRLSSFLEIKKIVERGGGQVLLFLSLFLSVHINFKKKLNSHTSLFILTFYLFSSIVLLIFCHLQFHCLFL